MEENKKYILSIETNGNPFTHILRELADHLDDIEKIPEDILFINTMSKYEECEPAEVEIEDATASMTHL